MTLFMPSLHDAAEAVKYAQGIREDLKIRILQPDEDTGQVLCLSAFNFIRAYYSIMLLHC